MSEKISNACESSNMPTSAGNHLGMSPDVQHSPDAFDPQVTVLGAITNETLGFADGSTELGAYLLKVTQAPRPAVTFDE